MECYRHSSISHTCSETDWLVIHSSSSSVEAYASIISPILPSCLFFKYQFAYGLSYFQNEAARVQACASQHNASWQRILQCPLKNKKTPCNSMPRKTSIHLPTNFWTRQDVTTACTCGGLENTSGNKKKTIPTVMLVYILVQIAFGLHRVRNIGHEYIHISMRCVTVSPVQSKPLEYQKSVGNYSRKINSKKNN